MAQEDFNNNNNARIVNVILGVWLFISAFLWPHSYPQMTNTWIVGVLAVAFALIATRVTEVRFLNTVLAIWLFVSVWALPSIAAGTRWNNAIVAIVMFLVSLAPELSGRAGTRPVARP